MKKVLKMMLKVILWLVPCAGTIVCFYYAAKTHLSLIGVLIDLYGKKYLDKDVAGSKGMTHEEFRALDGEAYNKVYDKACKTARLIEHAGWKWWLNK